jgi:hypothetical protein
MPSIPLEICKLKYVLAVGTAGEDVEVEIVDVPVLELAVVDGTLDDVDIETTVVVVGHLLVTGPVDELGTGAVTPGGRVIVVVTTNTLSVISGHRSGSGTVDSPMRQLS